MNRLWTLLVALCAVAHGAADVWLQAALPALLS
jgi:hypothetical protein